MLLDFGVNDGGRHVEDKSARQDLYSHFIGSSHEITDFPEEGLYHTFSIGNAPAKIRIIFLDTRYFRDAHWLRSLGEVKLPLTAILAALLRLVYITLGYGFDHTGDILGTKQWAWLEQILSTTDADFHVVVSSVQILTTNPIVESWGHFPVAKKRLFELLSRYDPSGIVFISGDIHAAELSRVLARSTNEHTTTGTPQSRNTREWTEVTSSGLTHTCSDSLLTRYVCPFMMRIYNRHRRRSSHLEASTFEMPHTTKSNSSQRSDVFIGRNVGLMRVLRREYEGIQFPVLSVQVLSLDQLELSVLRHQSMECDSVSEGVNSEELKNKLLEESVVLVTDVYSHAHHKLVGGVKRGDISGVDKEANENYLLPEFYRISDIAADALLVCSSAVLVALSVRCLVWTK